MSTLQNKVRKVYCQRMISLLLICVFTVCLTRLLLISHRYQLKSNKIYAYYLKCEAGSIAQAKTARFKHFGVRILAKILTCMNGDYCYFPLNLTMI